MMQLNANVSFKGDCQAAFRFYEQCLGGRLQRMMTWGESSMANQVSPEWHDKIIHASLIVGDSALLGSDSPPENYERPQGVSITVQLDDVAEGERIFKTLSEGGAIQMPFGKTFWAAGFGMCTDRFGISWMVNCGQPQ